MSKKGLNPGLAAKMESDFAEMDTRIEAALRKLEASSGLKASQKVLAELSNCSRCTINNRKWATLRLAGIKNARKSLNLRLNTKSREGTPEIDSVQRIQQQLNNSRDEVVVWKSKHDALFELHQAQRNIVQVLTKKMEILRDEVARLQNRNDPPP